MREKTPPNPWAKRPHIVRVPSIATFTNERTGRQVQVLYLHTVDRSRYTPEKLRELRRNRKHR